MAICLIHSALNSTHFLKLVLTLTTWINKQKLILFRSALFCSLCFNAACNPLNWFLNPTVWKSLVKADPSIYKVKSPGPCKVKGLVQIYNLCDWNDAGVSVCTLIERKTLSSFHLPKRSLPNHMHISMFWKVFSRTGVRWHLDLTISNINRAFVVLWRGDLQRWRVEAMTPHRGELLGIPHWLL